ncbi:MAG TPA: phosphatidate cytidylyltransferase [Chitinophagaceae bacterium]|nr:phosphatidate cytidylyltransferase [Chitinophagaceae bacterium]
MAFNWQTFRTRALTVIIFVIIMLVGLLWNQWSFLVLFSVVHFGCWWEYLRLMEKIYTTTLHIYTKLGLMLIGYGLMLWFCGPAYNIAGYGLKENFSLPVSGAGFILLVMGIFQKNKIELRSFGAAILGLLYISLSWGLMMDLYSNIEFNNPVLRTDGDKIDILFLPLFIIGCMWINDTMAYIVGSLIGKTPLSKISPKKTWEGTIGGIILSSLIMGYLAFSFDEWFVFGQSFSWWAILAMIASVTGTFGDLLESKLKRMAGVKDSGQIMPGHGGFLDRFDSLILATPFVWLYVNFFMH